MTTTAPAAQSIRVSITYGSYNDRRYGKPWIGVITAWPVGGRPDIRWGAYLGDFSGGDVEIQAAVGDVVRYGQKDHRGNNTDASWGIVAADGSVDDCSATEARVAWDARQSQSTQQAGPAENPLATVSDDDLIAEVRRRNLHLSVYAEPPTTR